MKHLKYLSYVIRHKWFVLIACWKRGLYWQGIVHDWSKFLPSEWFAYAESFYSKIPRDTRDSMRDQCFRITGSYPWPSLATVKARFDAAWLKHQHRSPHHWQHWVLREDSGKTKIVAMPHRYVLEMLADWEGAGRAITGKSGDSPLWYAKNRENMMLHPDTRAFVDAQLGYAAMR